MSGAWLASAETLETAAANGNNAAAAPVARQQPTWEYGPFINYGNGLGNRDTYKFLSAGFELGKQLFPVTHSGAFEFGVNVMPLWQAYTPAPHEQPVVIGGVNYGDAPYGGGTYRGVSITPVIFRWNFPTWRGHSTVVSGRGRTYLYHAQVSAGPVGDAWGAGRDLRMELFAAGRRGDSRSLRGRGGQSI